MGLSGKCWHNFSQEKILTWFICDTPLRLHASEGSPPHLIRPSNTLRWQLHYFPSTNIANYYTAALFARILHGAAAHATLSSAALPIFSETGVCVRPATSNRCLLLLLLLLFLLLFLLLLLLLLLLQLLLLLLLLQLLVPLQICPAVVSALLDIHSISKIL